MSGPFESLQQHLASWDKRRKVQAMAHWLPRSALIGLSLAGLLVFVSRLQPLLTPLELTGVVLLLLSLAVAIASSLIYVRRTNMMEQARFADRQLRLKERAITAVQIEMGTIQTTPTLTKQQIDDALAAANEIDPRRDLPLSVNRGELFAAVALFILLLVMIWLPNVQYGILQTNRAIAEAVDEQSAALGQLNEQIAQDATLSAQGREALLEPLEQAEANLAQPDLTQSEAVAALSEAESELRDLASTFDQSELQTALEAAAAALPDQASTEALSEAFAQSDLAASAAAAQQLAEQTAMLDHDAQQQLASDLAEAAETLVGADPELSDSLRAAAEALQIGEGEQAAEALSASAQMLQERANQQQTAEQAAEAAEQLRQGRQAVADVGAEGSPQVESPGSREEAPGNGGSAMSARESSAGPASNLENQATAGASGAAQDGASATSGGGEGGGRSENVFVPSPVDLSNIEGSDVELPVSCLEDPENCGPRAEENGDEPEQAGRPEGSSVPYQDVFGDYSDAAFEALETDYIPLGLQDLVREYFSSLEP